MPLSPAGLLPMNSGGEFLGVNPPPHERACTDAGVFHETSFPKITTIIGKEFTSCLIRISKAKISSEKEIKNHKLLIYSYLRKCSMWNINHVHLP